MADVGLSFSPTQQNQNQNQQYGNASPNQLVQDAIKILSFRMPSIVGAGAPAPGALLNGMGSGGSPFGALLQQWLQRPQNPMPLTPSPITSRLHPGPAVPGMPFRSPADQGPPSMPPGGATPGPSFQFQNPRPTPPAGPTGGGMPPTTAGNPVMPPGMGGSFGGFTNQV